MHRRGLRQVSRWAFVMPVILCLASTVSCSSTAYCQPGDPVVTPQQARPGDELQVDVPSREDGVGCQPRMPAQARYEVRVDFAPDPSGRSRVESLGVLDPTTDGDARGTVRLPDDIPVGDAEVSVSLTGAPTICDLDPSIGCAKPPFAPISVTN